MVKPESGLSMLDNSIAELSVALPCEWITQDEKERVVRDRSMHEGM